MSTGFLDRSISLDGTEFLYQVYVPRDYTPEVPWPVILFLHGAGERGTDGLLQTEIGLGTALRRHPDRYPSIVVFPQAPPESRWLGKAAVLAMATLEAARQEFNCDPGRIYLTGLSMGGHGCWNLAYQHPRQFAAMVVICGWAAPSERRPETIVPNAGDSPYDTLAEALKDIPIWIYHGADDPVVPVTESRRMAAALQAVGAVVTYTELPGVGHGSWDAAYQSAELPAWLFTQQR
jgi:predicted peptidase